MHYVTERLALVGLVDDTGREDYSNDDTLYICIITNSGKMEPGVMVISSLQPLCPEETPIQCPSVARKPRQCGHPVDNADDIPKSQIVL